MRSESSAGTNIVYILNAFQLTYETHDTPRIDGAPVDKHRHRGTKYLVATNANQSGDRNGKPCIGILPTCRDQAKSAQNSQGDPDVCGCMISIGRENL